MTKYLVWQFVTVILSIVSLATCILETPPKEKTKDAYHVKCFRDAVLAANSTQQRVDPKCVFAFKEYYRDFQRTLNYTDGQMNYLLSLERMMLKRLYNDAKRQRRQTMGMLPPRRECRTLSGAERDALFGTIVQLKQNSADGVTPDYDTIAGIHNMQAFPNAHNGPNFLGWHRVYLEMYEMALNDIRERAGLSDVAVCYWDSTLDFLMPGNSQTRTIAFSDALFGNGRGVVLNSRFANWQLLTGGTLRRSIGAGGTSLMRPTVVDLITSDPSINRHRQIVRGFPPFFFGFPDPDNRFQRISLESEHDNPHAWVGGIMQNVNASPNDPVFWFHHTFIDYIWELFRRKIRMNGIDPETDYPFVGGSHSPQANMVGFPGVRNQDGYLDRYARQYAPSPTCGDGCGGNLQFLYCPMGGAMNDRCVSREISTDVAPAGAAQEFAPAAVAAFGGRAAMAAMAPDAPMVASLETTDEIALRAAQAEGPIVLGGPTFQSSFADPRLS